MCLHTRVHTPGRRHFITKGNPNRNAFCFISPPSCKSLSSLVLSQASSHSLFLFAGFLFFHLPAIYSFLYSTNTWWISVYTAPWEGSRGTNTSGKYKPRPREAYTLVQEQINTQRRRVQKPSKKLASHHTGEGWNKTCSKERPWQGRMSLVLDGGNEGHRGLNKACSGYMRAKGSPLASFCPLTHDHTTLHICFGSGL